MLCNVGEGAAVCTCSLILPDIMRPRTRRSVGVTLLLYYTTLNKAVASDACES